MPNEPLRCRHIHAEGRQCGSPALRHEKLCYHHHSARRPARNPLGLPLLPDPEDLAAVQRGLAELLRLVTRELVDDKQAKRLFAILAQAGTNLARIERGRRAERAQVLAEARFTARHPESRLSGCHSQRESASVSASDSIEAVVTDPIDDPEFGLIAPGPDPEPRPLAPVPAAASPCRHPERSEGPRESSPHRNPSPFQPSTPLVPPEKPTRARQAEIDAQAKIEADFQRSEEEYRMERQRLRIIAREVIYPHLSPAARAREDALRAEEQAEQPAVDPPVSPLDC